MTGNVLLVVATLGLVCLLTGLSMISEPAALVTLGGALLAGALAIAYVRGSE